ncbi:SdrD B-like domain-containing protein [Pimelobacter simplex]|uniref:SdrD B-like domain-containing protein n=1 Tax=Nocardioides simplex TaxID=2045 RepID=UPI003AAF26DA
MKEFKVHTGADRIGRRPGRRTARIAALALGAGTLAFGVGVPTPPAAQAASGDGGLTVRVIRDMGANGAWDPVIDLALPGVAVTVTDAFGHTVSLTTDATGVATLPAGDPRLTGGKYRVNVANPDATYYTPAFASSADPADTPSATRLSSNQEFVDLSSGSDKTVTTGFWRARDYCQSNPQVANACQPGMFIHDGAGADARTDSQDTVFLTNYNNSAYQELAQSKTAGTDIGTGAVYGIAYDRIRKNVFSAAYAKRNVDYGPLGPGGLYVTDPATGLTRAFATVPNAGTTAHNSTGVANGGNEDFDFRTAVGKESLGAIVMSDDYTKLFVANLNDKKIYVYDVTDTSGAATPLTSFAIPDPGCANAGDWRPGGLGEADGVLYAGGVCSGESEGIARATTMRAVVQTFNETTYASIATVLDQSISYERAGDAYGCMGDAGWFGWNDDMWCGNNGQVNVPTPWLGKIVIEANGDMNLAFRDRTGDQLGVNLEGRTVAGGTVHPYYQVGGDLNKACLDGSGTYVLDSNGGCGIAPVAAGSPVNRFYDTHVIHPNGTFAGMTMSRAEPGLIIDEMDGGGAINTQAIVAKNRGTGNNTAGQTIGEASGLGYKFGKGQGLADMDVLCDLAPIQIGNRVWYNDAADGKQSAGENPVVGATVNLYDKQGNLVATTTTNDRGEYYFDSLTTEGLDYETDYVVKMDNPADYQPGGPLDRADWALSKTATGPEGNKATAGGDGYPAISLKTGKPGENNHDLDFGFTPKPSIHIVKYDGRLEGPVGGPLSHANNEASPTVYQAGPNGMTGAQPVAMIVTNDGNAALGNVKVTDETLSKPAMKGLTCDFSALGGPATGTTWAGMFLPGDSFPCTGTIDLEAGEVHADRIKVVGEQFNPLTNQPVAGVAPVTDADKYYAKTGYTSKIVITKKDKATGAEADTKGTALRFRPGQTRKIVMPATNLGTSPIRRVQVSDRTLSGAKVTDFRCTFPDGKTVKANRKGVVRWAASFGANPKTWKPGVTFKCTAKLTMKPGARLHGDKVTLTGSDPKGTRLTSKNRFYATTSQLAGVPATGARVLPGIR